MEKDDDTQSLPRVEVPEEYPLAGEEATREYQRLDGAPGYCEPAAHAAVPPQPGYYPQQPYPPAPNRSNPWKTFVIFAVLIAAAAGLAWVVYTQFLRPHPTAKNSASQPATTTVIVEETTVVAPPQEAGDTPAQAPATTESTAPQFRAPADAEQCAANVNWRIFRGSPNTTCGFAENTAIAMAMNSGTVGDVAVKVNSPATDQAYDMFCRHRGSNSFECTGGDNAVVYLEARSVRD